MANATMTPSALKTALKAALRETLAEERELFQEVIAQALEDFALSEAIREGKKSRRAPREDVFKALRGKG